MPRKSESSLRSLPKSARIANFIAALALLGFVLWLSLSGIGYHWNWKGFWKYHGLFIQGWLTTLWISTAALIGSTIIGLIFALASRAHFLPLRYISRIYVEITRGTPLLVQILIAYYGLANSIGIDNRYIVGGLTLSIFGGAYISEVIRAGIESVGKSQLESAQAIGLTMTQTYRYVIFPQAIRQILPPLTVQFAGLIKDSSLLAWIAVSELTFNAQLINNNTYSPLEAYLPLAAGYLLLTLPLSLWTRSLERKHHFDV